MVDLMLKRVEGQLRNKDMALDVTAAAKGLLAERGFDKVLGARPLRRTIQREIEDKLSEKILFDEIRPAQVITVDVAEVDDGKGGTTKEFTFRGDPKPAVAVPEPVAVGAGGGESGDAASAV
jgi:ATP-dependent Clp protease ATP-binding subunit ClpC